MKKQKSDKKKVIIPKKDFEMFFPLPPDLDVITDIVLHTRIRLGGPTSTWVEKIITIAAADIPAGAQTLMIELTPMAQTTDTIEMSAAWIECTRNILTS
jgi:hypothetical protein